MTKREVVVFDFDGTLTRRDSFIAFIRFARGERAFWFGILRHSILIAGYLLHIVENSRLKESIFKHFFEGMPYSTFCNLGRQFAVLIDSMTRCEIVAKLHDHVAAQHTVLVITASMGEWVAPWCAMQGVTDVLATRVEVDANRLLTGRLSTPNCYAEEKVRRLMQVEPNRMEYHLTVYGDSAGDRELMAMADTYFLLP